MVLASGQGDLGWKKYLVAGWAFMECLLFGGLLYGWASVNFVLKEEGIYADLCPASKNASVSDLNSTDVSGGANVSLVSVVTLPSVGGGVYNTSGVGGADVDDSSQVQQGSVCKPQDNNMALCFTIASVLFCVGCAVLGHINYKFGTRVTRIISMLMFFLGSLMMAFISKDMPWLMFPGLSLLGIGGLPLLVTNTQVANLFLTGSSSVVGLLCGGFDMSSAVMLMVKIASESGFSRQNMFFVITALHLLVLVSTFLFLPKDFIRKRAVSKGPSEVADDKDVAIELLPDKNNAETKPEETVPSLRSCLLKPIFLTHIVWLCLLQLRFYLFIGTLNQYLSRVLKGDNEQVGYFTNICFTIMMGGLITSFLSGIVYDWQKVRCKDGKSQQYRDVLPAALPLGVASGLSVLLSALVLIPEPALLYFIFIVMTIYRSFLYSLAAGFIGANFPSEYFGILYGVMIICGGVFGFLQYAFFTWSEAYIDAAFDVNIFLLCLMFLSFIHPIYITVTCLREERKFKLN